MTSKAKKVITGIVVSIVGTVVGMFIWKSFKD